MTEAEALEKKQHKSSNGSAPPEATREDVFDHTYKEKEGPKPPRTIVWKNVILMTLLHIGAAYGVFIIPSASPLTLLWSVMSAARPTSSHRWCMLTKRWWSHRSVHDPPSILHVGGDLDVGTNHQGCDATACSSKLRTV